MEFWLISNNEKYRLPVHPAEIEVDSGNTIQTVDIYNLGEINLGGRPRLMSISLSSFFPARDYYFLEYHNIKDAQQTVDMIDNWRINDNIVYFIVTQTSTNNLDSGKASINNTFKIENFKYKREAGTNDISYTLDLKEYRYTDGKDHKYYIGSTSKYSVASNSNYPRPSNIPNQKPTAYIVKKGDTLAVISKKIYGTTAKWREIATKNNIKNPSKIKIDQKLVI